MSKNQKDISERKGTIAYVFKQHLDELYECLDWYGVPEARKKVLQLLDDPSITDVEAVAQAKQIFATAKPHLFLSTLVTYMTGVKVS